MILRGLFIGFGVTALLMTGAFAQQALTPAEVVDDATQTAIAPEAVEEFVLGRGDVIDISVLEDSSLSRQVLVRPDGKISMPLAGSLQAEGRTPEQLQSDIREQLAKDFIEPPTVTVSLVRVAEAGAPGTEEIDLQSIYVLGQVGSPGRFDVTEPLDVLQALALAGGPGVFAATSRIQIRQRDENGGETVKLFDYDAIEDGAGAPFFELGDGTVIFVPERGIFE